MGFNNKYEMLAALSDIDEKYIKEADKLLAYRSEIDREVIRLVPEKRKFSWRSIAAAAACAVVLIGGTVLMSKFISRGIVDPPVESNSSDISGENTERQRYLDEMKKRYGASVNVAYARDRLNVTEFELPGEVNPQSLIASEACFIDESRALVMRSGKMEIYNFKEKTYEYVCEPIFDAADGANNVWHIDYVSSDYAVYSSTYFADKSKRAEPDKLYLLDIATHESRFIYVCENLRCNLGCDIGDIGDVDVANGKVYFTVYDEENHPSIYAYDIKSEKTEKLIDGGYSPEYYKGDLLYIEGGVTKSLSGKDNFPYYDGKSTFVNFGTGEEIFSSKTERPVWMGDSCDFGIVFREGGYPNPGAEQPEFIYYAPGNELLVFEEGDVITNDYEYWASFGWGLCVWKLADDGSVSGYMLTEKRAEIIENPERDIYSAEREQYKVSDSIKIFGLADKWEWREFEVNGYDDGFYGPMVTGRLQTNSAFLDERTMVTVRTLKDGSKEIAAYDLFDKTFTTVFGKDDEPWLSEGINYNIYYVNDGRIVFSAPFDMSSPWKGELRVIDAASGEWHAIPGDNNCAGSFLIEGNMLYYTVQDPERGQYDPNDLVYRYDLSLKGAGAPELVGSGAYRLFSYAGEIVYSTFEGDYGPQEMYGTEKLHKLGGGDPIDTEKYGKNAWVLKNAGYFSTDSYEVTNCITGEKLFELPGSRLDAVSDSCMTFGDINLNNPDHFLFDAKNNELFLYKNSGLEVNSVQWEWYKCGDGFCVFDEGVNTVSRGYILTRKASQPVVQVPKPPTENPLPDNVTFLNGSKSFISFVPIVSAEDAFDFRKAEKDDVFFGETPYPKNVDDNYEFAVVNGHKAMLESYIDIGHIVRLVALYDDSAKYPGGGGAKYGLLEYGLYDPETRSYTTLIKAEDYEGLPYYGHYTENYIFFEPENSTSIYIAVDLRSGLNGGEFKKINVGVGLVNTYSYRDIVEADGVLYFNAYEDEDDRDTPCLYSFDTKTGEQKMLEKNATPTKFRGEVFAYCGKMYPQLLKSLNGDHFTIKVYDKWYSGGTYRTRESKIGDITYEMVYNVITDEDMFGVAVSPLEDEEVYSNLIDYPCNDHYHRYWCDDHAGKRINLLFDFDRERLIIHDDEELPYFGYTNLSFWKVYDENEEIEYMLTPK